MGIWLVRPSKKIEISTDLIWRINYIQCCVPLILIIMRTLRKLTESEKSYWGTGDYGIVENGKVLFQGTYKGCLQWLGS